MGKARRDAVEWPTLALLVLCYGGWVIGTTWAAALWLPLGVGLSGLCIALHSSLSHEVLHGHPFRARRVNEALVFPALGLLIPYQRFRDTHLAHHRDAVLTDPYDDPETNYLDPVPWQRLPRWMQVVLRFNNTLAGRMIVGPLVGPLVRQVSFLASDWRAIRVGNGAVLRGWLWHIPAMALVLLWVTASATPLWAYLGLSILKIRTFLEHCAVERTSARTVIVEDRGPLALIFLNNNLHVVHHTHPLVAWYRLPNLYAQNRAQYLARNDGYVYRSYAEIFRRHFWRAKDSVPHPFWPWRRG